MEQQASLADCTNETPTMPMQEAFVARPGKRPCLEPVLQWKKLTSPIAESLSILQKKFITQRQRKYLPNYQPALPLCVTLAGYHRLNHITCCKRNKQIC